MNGIINLLKPPCMSSAQAVAFVKGVTGMKAGHAGTLDPEAAGVLPIMVGKATRLFDYLTEREKVYVAEVAFGASTDTQDATGTLLETGESLPSQEAVKRALGLFTGTVLQVPPSYSAIKRDGKAMYQLARAGVQVALEPRPVEVDSIDYLGSLGEDGHLIRVRCGKGTYIRTLCHDLGTHLGVPAHMRMLIRERSGRFTIRQAITPEELLAAHRAGIFSGPWLLTPEQAVDHLPAVGAKDGLLTRCLFGVPLQAEEVSLEGALAEGDAARVYCENTFLGIYEMRGNQLRVRLLLAQ